MQINLDASKTSVDTSTKIIKNNSAADVELIFENDSRTDKKTIDQSVFFLMYLKFMKGVSKSNKRNIFRHCYLNINLLFGKVTV